MTTRRRHHRTAHRIALGAATLAAACVVAPGAGTADDAAPGIDGLIVRLAPGADLATVAARHGTSASGSLAALDASLLTWTDGRTDDAVGADLALDPDVVFVNANRTARAPEVAFSGRIYKWASVPPTDATDQWALARIGGAGAGPGAGGAGVVVAVIDTGVDPDAPLLAGALDAGYDFVDGDTTPFDEANGLDDNANGVIDEAAGHGTHVAGIVRQVAPDARIMPIRVLDSDGGSDTFTVAAAMLWAADHGADVVNLSLGQSGSSDLLREAAQLLWNRGVLVVGAAGNEAESRDSFPASARCAISVAASDRTDALADFTSWSSKVDVAAPGVDVVSAFPYSTTGTAAWSGTSMAAPIVAGGAAVLRSMRPDLPVATIARIITRSGPLVPGPPGSTEPLRRISLAAAAARVRAATPADDGCLQ